MVRFIRLLLNEKGRFLWSAHRITERQKAGKARSIKGKQLKNSRNTASKPHVALLSSPRDSFILPANQSAPAMGRTFCIYPLSPLWGKRAFWVFSQQKGISRRVAQWEASKCGRWKSGAKKRERCCFFPRICRKRTLFTQKVEDIRGTTIHGTGENEFLLQRKCMENFTNYLCVYNKTERILNSKTV